jgi:prepilin-type N-terminal cleavage/methylation domain-containing protein
VQHSSFGFRRGFTLVELVVVIGILSILIALLVPSISSVRPAADRIICMSHLRELWLHFAPAATEPDGWPQLPSGIKIGSVEEENFWLDYSRNSLDVPEKLWHCPAIDRSIRRAPPTDHLPVIHYVPTLFDSRPGTPNKWPSMPWFSEIGNVHGEGNLVIRSDGAVVPSSPLP